VLRVQRLNILTDIVKRLRAENHKDDHIMLVLEDYCDRNFMVGYSTKWDYIQAAIRTA
jgi:hypothetical protein